jgi:hypothetical protein
VSQFLRAEPDVAFQVDLASQDSAESPAKLYLCEPSKRESGGTCTPCRADSFSLLAGHIFNYL